MGCALPKAPVGLGAPAPVLAYGVDFGWSCPNTAAFGASYLSHDPSKDWTRSCVNAYHRRGAATVAVFETAADRAQAGYRAGYDDAKHAAAELPSLSAPPRQPFDMAIDCDCTPSTLVGYFQGANAAEPHRINAYGGYRQILYLYRHGLVGHLNWQTYAWSGGLWLPASIAPLEQFLNGSSLDYDRAIARNYGQWPYTAPKPKPAKVVCFGPHARTHNQTCVKLRAQAAHWVRARDASARVYARQGCPVLDQRQRWFAAKIKAQPHSRKTRQRRSALAASRHVYRARRCPVYAQRASYFQSRINAAVSH